jgi:hypothetical protein
VAEKIEGLPRLEGLLTLLPDEPRGRLWLELPPPRGRSGEIGRFLYVELDEDRSSLDPAATLVFADNVELEALLTFSARKPGPEVRRTTPSARSVTLVQHHSLIRLPDDGYRPRRFDPRTASFAMSFVDYAAPLDEPLEQRWITRHRLEKVDPGRPRSPVREPRPASAIAPR